jgi:hypothetical protein
MQNIKDDLSIIIMSPTKKNAEEHEAICQIKQIIFQLFTSIGSNFKYEMN